ncbi:hypothetical protein TNCV_2519381 [Trichonephila clavipes]|nr:hypothetical protein TNCV_2519381 [Trichonephila clavipes]
MNLEFEECVVIRISAYTVDGRATVRPMRRQLSAVDLVRRGSVAPAARETLSVRGGQPVARWSCNGGTRRPCKIKRILNT